MKHSGRSKHSHHTIATNQVQPSAVVMIGYMFLHFQSKLQFADVFVSFVSCEKYYTAVYSNCTTLATILPKINLTKSPCVALSYTISLLFDDRT